jgi:GAF domain-containing protein
VKRFRYITYAVLAGATLLALVPMGQQARSLLGPEEAAPGATDWVRWEEQEGVLVAGYVPPGSPAARAGLRAGDRLYMFNYRRYRERAPLREAVAQARPGAERVYHVRRGDSYERLRVRLTAPPAFLYPLSPGLWNFSLWGFGFAAFFHLLALIVTGPLAWRARRARASLAVVAASAVWVFCALARLLIVEAAGLPAAGTSLGTAFDGLALAGAAGCGLFPALLLHKVARDTQEAAGRRPTWLRFAVYLPLAAGVGVLLGGEGAAAVRLATLTKPMLLYLCTFVAAAAGLVLAYLRGAPASAPPVSWGDTGGAFLLVAAGVGGGLVRFAGPSTASLTDPTVGVLVVAVALLPTVPVLLMTLAALRRATPGRLFGRALVYAVVLGATFFAFVGGYTIIRSYLGAAGGAAHYVAMGLFAVALLLVFERAARRLRRYAGRYFATGPQRARQKLGRFQEQMRTILTHEKLAQRTAAVVGEAFDARSVRLFLRAAPPPEEADADPPGPGGSEDDPEDAKGGWITGAYHPEPPYFTEQHFEQIWPLVRREGRVWARNPELRESTLPERRAQMLEERGVALALPIMGEGEPIGLLAMGGKQKRGVLYDAADLDLLRFLGGQLALAVERLDLVARERALVRASAQAELAALRAQINPHFLFNALNTIASLIEGRPEEAEDTVEHLSAIFRYILQTGSQSFVPLREEIALVRHYLHIEQVRFGDTLRVEIDLPPALAPHAVPAFAVQTLVENAVKHGIARQRGGGRVRVTARRLAAPAASKQAVEVVVDDTGAGIPELFPPEAGGDGAASNSRPGEEAGERARSDDRKGNSGKNERSPHPSFYGVGLRNVADRLERLYGRTDLLGFESAAGAGTTARLLVPPAPEEEDDAAQAGTPPEAMRRV